MSNKELDSGSWIGNYPCVASESDKLKHCNSSDALGVYMHEGEDGVWYDGYCRSCGQFISKDLLHKSSLAGELGIDTEGKTSPERKFKVKPKPEPLTMEQTKALINQMGYKSNGYRGIKDEYNQFFGHLSQLDSNGNVIARYYPETKDGKVMGYKSRLHPKRFGYANHGLTGISNELSGQIKFKGGGKYILITAGEEDKVAAYQMLSESRSNTEYDAIHVVSPTTGEMSASKQIAAQYDFFDNYENIIIGMDSDSVGKEAALKIAAVLPADKVKIATWSMKDPNTMLLSGKSKQFVREFYAAKEFVDTGIKSSANIMDDVKDVLLAEKVGLPKYMHRLEKMMKRALTKGNRVCNIAGPTSCGKSTHVNAMIYKWIFEDGLKPLIISLEMTSGEYAVDLLSLHLQKNLDWFEEGMDAWNYLERDDVKLLYQDLFVDEFGEERFRLVDDRDGKLETLKNQIERGVKQYGCNLVVIDVLTDVLRFLPMDEQERFMQWEKNFVKQGINIINVMHCRKPSKDKEGKMIKATEFDILGSSTFAQSAHITIIINRDKMAECPIERNRTYVDMPKCRRGTTGEAGSWFYDFKTRQVYDYEDYMNGLVGDNASTLIPEEVNVTDAVDNNTGEVYDDTF